MIFYYKNSKNKTISLEDGVIRLKNGLIHQYRWNPKATKLRFGELVEAFEKDALSYELTFRIRGDIEERKQFLNEFVGITEADVLANMPGRLYVGDYYLDCYILASETGKSSDFTHWSEKKVAVYAPHPFWKKEVKYYIPPVDIEGEIEFFEVPVRFVNSHYADTDYILTAYGPFEFLLFQMNGEHHIVNAPCQDGEKIILNTQKETVVKIDAEGNEANIYSAQDFSNDIFRPIPPGAVEFNYSRRNPMGLTLLVERSEPEWYSATLGEQSILITEDGRGLITEDGYYIAINTEG